MRTQQELEEIELELRNHIDKNYGALKGREGKIIKIHPPTRSRNGNIFKRIEFKMENGDWAKTDICPDYRNAVRWQKALDKGVGTVCKNLEMRDSKTINADSKVIY